MSWAPYATIYILVLIGLTLLFKVFYNGRWNFKDFTIAYFIVRPFDLCLKFAARNLGGSIVSLIVFLLAKLGFIKAASVPPKCVDIWTGKAESRR